MYRTYDLACLTYQIKFMTATKLTAFSSQLKHEVSGSKYMAIDFIVGIGFATCLVQNNHIIT